MQHMARVPIWGNERQGSTRYWYETRFSAVVDTGGKVVITIAKEKFPKKTHVEREGLCHCRLHALGAGSSERMLDGVPHNTLISFVSQYASSVEASLVRNDPVICDICEKYKLI